MFKQSLKSGGSIGPMIMAEDRVLSDLALNATHHDGDITVKEANLAYRIKMTGPRATPPSWAAVRKVVHRLRMGQSTSGSWRSWPRARSAT